MFENLSQKLTTTLRKVRGQGRLTETNIDDSLKEVKMALLEADVNFRVVKAFLKSVKSRAIGEEVQGSLTPGQQFIKIVNDELTNMMGASNESLTKSEDGPTVVMVVGLQGAGKTSSVGKLASYHAQKGFSPYLVPADVYRPAAIQQLTTLANELEVDVFEGAENRSPVEIVREPLISDAPSTSKVVFPIAAVPFTVNAPVISVTSPILYVQPELTVRLPFMVVVPAPE